MFRFIARFFTSTRRRRIGWTIVSSLITVVMVALLVTANTNASWIVALVWLIAFAIFMIGIWVDHPTVSAVGAIVSSFILLGLLCSTPQHAIQGISNAARLFGDLFADSSAQAVCYYRPPESVQVYQYQVGEGTQYYNAVDGFYYDWLCIGPNSVQISPIVQPVETQIPQVVLEAAPTGEQGSTLPTTAPTGGNTVDAEIVFTALKALEYSELQTPDPTRQTVFPDVPHQGRPALVAYESPFEDGDFCDNVPCGMDVPQYYFRVMTAGQVTIPELGVDCIAADTQGCLVIVINHYGETSMFRDNTIDHGFTVAGRVFNMDTPDMVMLAGQALLDHFAGRMTASEDGANCGTIDACESVEWHVVVIGDDMPQKHWTGIYSRP